MTRRSTAFASLLAGTLLLGPTSSFAQVADDPFGGLGDPFARDIDQEDADYFASPAAEPASLSRPVLAPAASRDVTAAFATERPVKAAPSVPVIADRPARPQAGDLLLFLCAALALLMPAGFAMLEAGFNSSRHAVDNLFKNVLSLAVAGLAFFLVGYHLMFPVTPAKENFVGEFSAGIDGSIKSSGSLAADAGGEQIQFLFRFALAAVAAAIVTGAVAGRMKFGASVLCGAVVAGIVYPVAGYWKWGGGWLDDLGFYDIAGAGLVHMAGGFAGLAGAILLGPRMGRYTAEGRPIAIPGHSLPLATLGIFVLFVGCYGINVGGLTGLSSDTPYAQMIGLVAVNTTLAGCAGCCLATGLSWILFGKPDLSMALSGLLGGLVASAGGCDGVTNLESLGIGAAAGGAVVLSIIMLDKLRIDDPVGAFPVHGVCGLWGVLACSLFGDTASWGHVGGDPAAPVYGNASAQFAGAIAIAGFSFACMLGLLGILKTAGFLRVSPEDDERGLGTGEHGLTAYAA